MPAFDDPAFAHLHDQHRQVIRNLKRGHYVLDMASQPSALFMKPSDSELRRFGIT
jgi:hypothetical protein